MPVIDEFLKWAMRANTAMMPKVRRDQVEQYQNPDRDVFPKQPLRPTDLTKFQDQDFRSMAKYIPARIDMPAGLAGADPNTLKLPMKLNAEELYGSWGDNLMFGDIKGIPRRMGLGSATVSIGGKPDDLYLSIFDSWDEPTGHGPYFDNATGKPFNVYDRVPIKLKNGRIPERIQGQPDVELPNDELLNLLVSRSR